MSWLKWYHLGVPDEEGAERDNIREKLSLFYHCLNCTALSGCYFPVVNFPVSPVHPNCDCLLFDIDVSFNDISAICDIRKFTEYLFNYDKNNGKAYLFESWGFNVGDSQTLKEIFEMQAKEKYLSGDFILQKSDRYGQRITINIRLQDNENNARVFKTGWMVHPLGKITCITIFSGGSMKKFELYDEITLNKQIDELSRRGINKGCRGTIAEIGDKKNLVLFYNHVDFGDYAFAWVADEDLDYSGKYPEWLLNDFIKFIKTHDPAKKLSFSKTELQEYDFVELTVDRKEYADEGVHKGMRGTILNPEKIRGCWQVYFADETGADFAAVPVREEDLKLIKR